MISCWECFTCGLPIDSKKDHFVYEKYLDGNADRLYCTACGIEKAKDHPDLINIYNEDAQLARNKIEGKPLIIKRTREQYEVCKKYLNPNIIVDIQD